MGIQEMQKSGRRLVVLFLDSEDNLRSAIGRLLAAGRPDIDPIFVADGDQAMDEIRSIHTEQRHLDLLVTDYAHPPGPDGAELVRWIRNLPDDFTMRGGRRIKHLPIVVQSGNRSAGKAKDVSSDVVLLWKPYKLEALLDAIDLALQRK
jgi:CheY-like chemotaxis protein